MTDEEYAPQSDHPITALMGNMYQYFREYPHFDRGRPIEKRLAVDRVSSSGRTRTKSSCCRSWKLETLDA